MNIYRFKEFKPEEKDAVHKTLEIVENILEFGLEGVTRYLFSKTKILEWVLQKLSPGIPFNENKHHASEILSILLQNNEASQGEFGAAGGFLSVVSALTVSHAS